MSILTLEGIVDHGQIRLPANVRLPENTKVYVLVPAVHVEAIVRVESPQLAHAADAADFAMEIGVADAGV
jgi:hypothetical protein